MYAVAALSARPVPRDGCWLPLMPDNGKELVYTPSVTRNAESCPALTSALLICQDGYEHDTAVNSELLCLTNGRWAGELPKRVPKGKHQLLAVVSEREVFLLHMGSVWF